MNGIKKISIKEFRELGYLQELNRQFLHPLGMALEVIVNDETGEELLGAVWDYRDDLEGMVFESFDFEKAKNINVEWKQKEITRKEKFGWMIQPIIKNE